MRFILPLLIAAASFGISSRAAQFTLGAHHFTLSDGFTIEVAAPPSLSSRPIEADFDEQGRLYVTDSSGSNDKVAKQLVDKPHRILRLEDTDGDGVFDKSVVFADKMMFPEGCLWLDGSLYVSAPPSIWKLTDTNNDGVADTRVEWFKGQTLGGCANDLHGPYLGPDGWIYWCKGGFEKQTHTLGNGISFTSRASQIYRARPDGTLLEPIMTGGMDNPVGLAWSAEGELFLCGTFFQHPAGGRRDGLIHVVYGGVYGKENDALDGHPRTGELLPIMTHLGPAAPCGMARYESSSFGAEYQNNLFVCQFNLHKISRHVLKPSGSSFVTTDSDFLVSDNTDFHPTDVLEDADGSLLVVDTGGWYKLCCPTSQLQKPDVLGAIYRIRRQDAEKIKDPRGLKLAWDSMKTSELVKLLEDDRPFVVKRAVSALARHRDDAVGLLAVPLRPESPANQRLSEKGSRNALWALTRMNDEAAREVGRFALRPGQPESVVQTELASAALRRDRYAALWYAGKFLNSGNPALRRAAITLLGRTGAGSMAIEAAAKSDDRILDHAIIYAMIESGDHEKILAGLDSTNVFVHRACLIALDQMEGGTLTPANVMPLLNAADDRLQNAAYWVAEHHSAWGPEIARLLQKRFETRRAVGEIPRYASLLAASASNTEVQQRLVEMSSTHAYASQATALSAMGRSHLTQVPATWGEAVRAGLQSLWEPNKHLALSAARSFSTAKQNKTELNDALLFFARDESQPADMRLEALTIMPGTAITPNPGTISFLRRELVSTNSAVERSGAAAVFAKLNLDEAQLLTLVGDLKNTGPIELPKLLPAFSRSTNEGLGFALVEALKEARAFRSLRAEQVTPSLTNFPANVRARAGELIATLNTDAAKQKAQLDELALKLALNFNKPDIRRGQAIFNSPKAACSTCHAIGYLGGNLGPDLTRIGQVRNERDLLESIVFPSASFVRSFEPMLVVTKSGDEHSGIIRRDAPDEILLAIGPNLEVRVPRAEIAEMRPGTVSVMPQGLDQQLTRAELADLLAFLKATKW